MLKFYRVLSLVLILFVFGCGYKPILDSKNYNFSINFGNNEGDETINKFIIERLEYLKDENKSKTFQITLESTLDKIIISKDSKGDPSIFESNIITLINVKNENGNLFKRKISKKNTYNNKSDKFELEQYENILIKNASENIAEEILSYLSNL